MIQLLLRMDIKPAIMPRISMRILRKNILDEGMHMKFVNVLDGLKYIRNGLSVESMRK